jgi:hypothetical protein
MFERIGQIKPQAVVLASSSGYSIEPARWQGGLNRTVERLQQMGAKVGYLRDIPFPGFDVPGCHARAAWRQWSLERSCTYLAADEEARISQLAQAEEAVLAQRGALSINLSSAICDEPVCKTAREGLILFKDRNHLTEEFALSLAPRLETQLLELLDPGAPSTAKAGR